MSTYNTFINGCWCRCVVFNRLTIIYIKISKKIYFIYKTAICIHTCGYGVLPSASICADSG